jgi:uncharacterized LabA/DUF88 family protein
MQIFPHERLGLFIDGSNLHAASRALGFSIDYRRLLHVFRQQALLLRALYYTTLIDDDGPNPLRPLMDWLDYNGYTTVTKPARQYRDGESWQPSKIDVELAVDAMRLRSALNHVVLFSGNGDFRALVAALQEHGTRVTVVSTLATQPAMVADELRRQADQFVDLVDLADHIERQPGTTAVRRAKPTAAVMT